jgi:hypothetical protein
MNFIEGGGKVSVSFLDEAEFKEIYYRSSG